MKKFILPFLAILYTSLAFGQNTFKAIIKDSESKELLFGATAILQGTTNGASANQNGYIEIKNIPCLLISHDLSDVLKLSHSIGIINQGKLILNGDIHKLFKSQNKVVINLKNACIYFP